MVRVYLKSRQALEETPELLRKEKGVNIKERTKGGVQEEPSKNGRSPISSSASERGN